MGARGGFGSTGGGWGGGDDERTAVLPRSGHNLHLGTGRNLAAAAPSEDLGGRALPGAHLVAKGGIAEKINKVAESIGVGEKIDALTKSNGTKAEVDLGDVLQKASKLAR